jgi:hypothetical protein
VAYEERQPGLGDDFLGQFERTLRRIVAEPERWLNPPEWTRTEYLEFPASMGGPWARYVDCGGKRSATPLSDSSGPSPVL